nr:EamA family transporter [Spirochaeta sp.]
MTRRLPTAGFIFLILLAMLSWGGSWPSGKLIAGLARAEVIIFWRYFITSLSIIPLLFIFKQSFRIAKRSLPLLILGAVVMITYNQLFLTGLKIGFAGAGGVLTTSLNPIITFILASVIYRESVRPWQKIGLLLGVIGGAVLLDVFKLD